MTAGSMPSERYYRQQAAALLSWARATHDKAWAQVLRQRAARELERAAEGTSAVTDLNPLLEEFNESQIRKEPPRVQHMPMQQQPVQQQPVQQQQSRITREDKE
jgi:hypothetical protein